MATLPRATSRQEYEQWFKDADKNHDGFLTSKELKKLFKSKGYKTSSKVFKQQFASLDSDSDKKISLEEYLKAVGDIPDDKLESMRGSSDSESDDDVTGGRPAPSEQLEKWFKDADKNNDGFLTAKELKNMFKAKGIKYSRKEFKKHFASLDIDGDKKITLQEYLKVMTAVPIAEQKTSADSAERGSQQQYEKWFRDADVNKDGFLTAKELKKMLKTNGLKMSSKAAKSYFETLDRDHDKKISLAEYLEAMGHVTADVSDDAVKTSDPLAPFRPTGVSDVPENRKSQDPTGTQSKQHQLTSQRDESTETSDVYTVASESEIRALFKEADTNDDGFLDVDEMKRVLSRTHTGLTNKQLFDIMYKADTDKSGLINYNEFLVLWIKEHGLLKD